MFLGQYFVDERLAPARKRVVKLQLTAREREVMCLLADGSTSKEAALRLRISIRTVESHRTNMNRKLGLSSVADLVRYAIRNGIVDSV